MLFLDRSPVAPPKSVIEITPKHNPASLPPLTITVSDIQPATREGYARNRPAIAVLTVGNPGRAYRMAKPEPGTQFSRYSCAESTTFYCAADSWLVFTHAASGKSFDVQVKWIAEPGRQSWDERSPDGQFVNRTNWPSHRLGEVRLGFLDDAKNFGIVRGEAKLRRKAEIGSGSKAAKTDGPVASEEFRKAADIETEQGGVVAYGGLRKAEQSVSCDSAVRQLYPIKLPPLGLIPPYGAVTASLPDGPPPITWI